MTTPVSSERPLPPAPPGGREEPALRPLRLRHNFLWTLAGFGIYGTCQWGMRAAVAKLGTPEMLGRFSLAFAICAPIVMFTNLQLRNIQATDARGEYHFRDYLTLRAIGAFVAMVVIAAIAVVMYVLGHGISAAVTILIVGLAKTAESLSDVIYGLLQKWERLDLSARAQMIKGPAALIALASLIYVTREIVWGVTGILLVWTVMLVTYDASNARRVLAAFAGQEKLTASQPLFARLPAIKRLAVLTLPMGVVGLLDSLNVNVPRYFIAHHLGERSLGYFSAMADLIVAGNLVVIALATSSASRLSHAYMRSAGSFMRLVLRLVAFGAVLGLAALGVAFFFGRPLLALLYKPEYAEYQEVFVWLMAAAGVGYIYRFLIYSMTAARYLRCQTPLYACSLAVQVGMSAWLIPTHGLPGAAWAVFAGMTVILLGSAGVNVYAIRRRAEQEEVPPRPPNLPGAPE